MAVFAYMVTKNEANRYLHACLEQLRETVDGIAVYDDQSTDNTVEIAKQFGCQVTVRPDDVPAFIEHESDFRQAAWNWATRTFAMSSHDWVLAIDADEFLMDPMRDPKRKLNRVVAAQTAETTAILLKVVEVFGFTEDGTPLARVDGYWDKIEGTRLFRYQPGGVFSGKPMGSGAEPTYVTKKISRNNAGMYLLHYGYARQSDQLDKYKRYSTLDNHGHANTHVESIVRHGELRPFQGAYVSGLHV